ncbi:MAG: PepSY domain-containing protein [Tardiphaga sp.]
MRIGMLSGLAIAGVLATLAGAAAQQKPSTGPAPAADTSRAPEPGANSFVESQARDLLTSHGYTDVSPLVNDRQGIWRGTAKKGADRVTVSVDYKGHVTTHP